MTATRREYAGPGDLRHMQHLAQRIWSPAGKFHIGDLAWGMSSAPDPSLFRIGIWTDAGEVVAWAWAEPPGHMELLVDPAHDYLAAEAFSWFESVAARTELSCTVMEGDTFVREALEDRGYRPLADGPFFIRHARDLADLPPVELPDGFAIDQVRPGQAARRAAVHRAGWSEFCSRLSADSYARVMTAYPYRPHTDLVVATPDGRWVASALGWYDEINEVGLVEPVSCDPAFRNRGLTRAVNVALLQVFRDLGARSAVILPRGDSGYPAPGLLYRSIGYSAGPRTIRYTRSG